MLAAPHGHADPDRLGGLPAQVGQGVINDAAGKSAHQVDVVVSGVADGKKTPLLAIGEAKWGEVMGSAHIDRLRLIRTFVSAGGRYDTAHTKLMCFSGAGFTRGLRELASTDSAILLIDASELYGIK